MGKIVKVKEEDLERELFLLVTEKEDVDILIVNHITLKVEFKPALHNSNYQVDSLGLNLLFLGISISKLGKVYRINIYPENATNRELEAIKIDPNIKNYVVINRSEKDYKALEYLERIDIYEKELYSDPLNTMQLELTASNLNLHNHLRKLSDYAESFNNPEIKPTSSKYVEVLKLIRDLNRLKSDKENIVYKNKLSIAADLFDMYFKERFSFGILNLGVYISSLLANIGEVEKGKKVYFKTLMYLEKEYDEFTQTIVKEYKDILFVKSNSMFSLEEYKHITRDMTFTNAKTQFVFNINLAAKYIDADRFEEALEILMQMKADIDAENSDKVKYLDILKNNKLICELKQSNIDIILNEFNKLKHKHIIFAINYNMLCSLTENNEPIDIEKEFSQKLVFDFYKTFNEIQKSLLNIEALPELNTMYLEGLFEEHYDLYIEKIKKVKSLECTTNNQIHFEVVKTLLIDFNIWDYLDLKGS